MPIHKEVNSQFFKKWSPAMAYVLGFFAADGSMFVNQRGGHYIGWYSTDRTILSKIQQALGSTHRIGVRRRREINFAASYVLQIGRTVWFRDLQRLGMRERKSSYLKFPKVPRSFVSDFVRGYFDGDGNVTVSRFIRKARRNRRSITILAGFISGSKEFLIGLRAVLVQYAGMGQGTLYFANRGHRLYYSVRDSRRLADFMYNKHALDSGLFLRRKYNIFRSYDRLVPQKQ